MYTTSNRVVTRVWAAFAAVTLILSAFPAPFFVAHAATSVSFTLFVIPNPVGTDSDLEYLSLSNTSSQDVDLSGWKLVDEDLNELALSGTLAGPGDTLACANDDFAQNGGKNCDYEFSGGFGLDNDGGSVSLVAPDDTVVVVTSWSDVSGSESNAAVSQSGSLSNVLETTGGDKIDICHATASQDNPYVQQSPNVNSFFSSGHDADLEDIIPPFFYDNGEGVKYFPGTNWNDDGQTIWRNQCSDPQGPDTYDIYGYKWNDVNGSTDRDKDEQGLLGWTIELYQGDTLVHSTTTDDQGNYHLSGVLPGDYALCEVQQGGWMQTYPTLNDGCHLITITDNSVRGFNFGNQEIPDVPPVCEIGDNLLLNGSFEDPVADANSAAGGFWELFDSVPNWVIEKVSDDTLFTLELWNNMFGGASDGDQNVELGGDGEATKVSQTVATIPGAVYELSFDFSPRIRTNEADNNVDALIDDVVLMNASGTGVGLTQNTWSTHSEQFVADDATTKVTLKDVGTQNGTGSLVDNAVLCLIEEPVEPCEDEHPGWADEAIDSAQGNKKNGSAVAANRSNTDDALGESDWSEGDADGFYSLGFGGSLTVKFDKYVPNEVGDDISVHEATNGTYPEELAKVEVSQDGSIWYELTERASNLKNEGGNNVTLLDIDETGLAWIKYVRITDMSNPDLHVAGADAFDVDAIDAVAELCEEPEPEPVEECEIEGHKYDRKGNPLKDWSMGLLKRIVHDNGVDEYDLATDVTDEDGYYCLEWDGETREIRGESTYEDGDYTFMYRVYEKMKEGWFNVSVEEGADVDNLEVVPDEEVERDDEEVSVQIGEDNGYIIANAAHHVDFYNDEDRLVCEPGVELLANGSFEEPVVTDDAGWDIFAQGAAGLAWLVEWVSPDGDATDPASIELHGDVNGWLPSDGDQYAELDGDYEGPSGDSGEPASTKISQTIETIPGEEYTLSWDFSPRPGQGGGENDLEVYVNDVLSDSVNGDGLALDNTDWSSHSITFTADSDETTVAFMDDGTPNSVGTFLDNVSLVCEPEFSVPYCGDGEVNQEWEQCDGEEGCADYCLWENQCHDEQLVKITLDPQAPQSQSFDNTIHLGAAGNTIPSGTWFKFDEVGDDTVQSIASDAGVEGLAVERTASELRLAVLGGNAREYFDYAFGTIEVLGLEMGALDRATVPVWALEDSGDYIDVWEVNSNVLDFQWYLTTGDDAAAVALTASEEYGQCEEKLTCDISSSENPVNVDSSFTISWQTEGADFVEITNIGSDLDLDGSTSTSLTDTTTYTLTAWNDQEESVQCEVTVDKNTGGGGGGGNRGGGGGGSNDGGDDEDEETPQPQILGEQTSIVPAGAPNAGAGAMQGVNPIAVYVFVLLGLAAYTFRFLKIVK